jgi:hypothetical protein
MSDQQTELEATPQTEPTDAAGVTPESTDEATDNGSDLARIQATLKKVRSEKLAAAERARKAEEKAATADSLATEVEKLKAKLTRQDIGHELGLPKSITSLLQGKDAEEMRAHAETLMADLATLAAPKAGPKPVRPVESLQTGSGKAETGPRQLSRDDIRGMNADAIEAARVAGQLNTLLGIK